MRTHCVAMPPPLLNDDLDLYARPAPLETQALVADFAVEDFRRIILPGFTQIDQGDLDAPIFEGFEP